MNIDMWVWIISMIIIFVIQIFNCIMMKENTRQMEVLHGFALELIAEQVKRLDKETSPCKQP